MTTALSTTTATTRACPFVGPRSFRFDEPLFGRSHEVSRLLNLLIAERIVLMFSPSGAGKTSLIQAGLIRALRDEDFFDLPIIRVQQPALPEDAGNLRINRFIRSTLESLESPRPGLDQAPPKHLVSRHKLKPAFRRWASALRSTPRGPRPNLVLIFDQFEDVITTDPADIAAKEEFFDQLGDTLKDPGLWALFAMREEYIAALEPYLNRIPRRLASRFRLDLLNAGSAREAFEGTLQSGGVSVDPGAVTRLVDDLCRVRVQRPDGTTEKVMGPYVEPVHLQIVGLRLWNRYACDPAFARLEEAHLSGTEGDVDAALAGYYADKVREIAAASGVSERTIREWCERELLTDQGLRGQILRGPKATRGLREPVIRQLIDAFLVRAEERRGSTWYELAHDRLVEPIRKSNIAWLKQNPGPIERRAVLWDESSRPDSLLLRDQELIEAENLPVESKGMMTSLEQEYLDASRSARTRAEEKQAMEAARARAEEKQVQEAARARQTRWILVGLSSGLIVTIVLVVIAVSQWKRSEEQRLKAERLVAFLSLQRGLTYYEEGEVGTGMLCLAQSLRDLPPQDADLKRILRTQLSSWREEIHALQEQLTHRGPVWAVAFSPGGKTVLTGSFDGTARLWDASTGWPIGQPMVHQGIVRAVAYGPGGKAVLTGSEDGTARLWDGNSGMPIGQPMVHQGAVRSVAFRFPDGKVVLTGSEDGTARLWDASSGKPIGRPLRHQDAIYSVAFGPDGKTVLTGSDDKTARLWNAESGNPIGQAMVHKGKIRTVAFGPNGAAVLTGSDDATARLWDARTGQSIGQPMVHQGIVWAIAFSPDSKAVLTGSEDSKARLWDAATGHLLGQPLEHRGPVRAVAFGPDGAAVLTGSFDNTARLWNAASGTPIGAPLKYQGPVWAVAFSPDGKAVLIGSTDNTARLWNANAGQPGGTILQHQDVVNAVAFAPDGMAVLTGSDDKTARLWNARTGQPIGQPMEHQGAVRAVAFRPDRKAVLTGSEDGTSRLWDAESGSPIGVSMVHGNGVLAVAFDPNSQIAVTASFDHTARLWNARTGHSVGALMKHDGPVWAVAFSPKGKVVLTGSEDKTARLWDATSGKPVGQPLVHEGPVWAVAFSPPDGKTVLTGSDDHTARLWDPESGKPLGRPLNHRGDVRAVAFGPDGKTVLTGSFDNTARLWDPESGKPLSQPLEHRGPVRSVAFGRDGKAVLTGSFDNTARLWDATTLRDPATGQLISLTLLYLVHRRAVAAVAFSPDGKTVLTGSYDKTARLWKVPLPIEGEVDRIMLWTKVITGMELDEWGSIRFLDDSTWRRYRRELQQLGGLPP
jgi:WD40 repeat protein